MDSDTFSINDLPFEILMEIFEYFSISEIARFPMTCTHWRDLMQQDHFWVSLARKTYGQYVGETPTKKQLEELSQRCGHELTFMHWLQYRSLFGLTMNMAVHVSASVPDEVFDYKVTLEPGLNATDYQPAKVIWRAQHFTGGISAVKWNATFTIVITPEDGEPIRKEVALINITETTSRQQIRHRGKTFKFNLKLTKMVQNELEEIRNMFLFAITAPPKFASEAKLCKFLRSQHHPITALDTLVPFNFEYQGTTTEFLVARVGFKMHMFKKLYRYENPFIYPPAGIFKEQYPDSSVVFIYRNLQLHEYTSVLANNFNDQIKSQIHLYLAEIVCGFEFLHENRLHMKDCIPIIKSDGHLQFIYVGPRDREVFSYFGLAPENERGSGSWFQTECYCLGVFMLEVCTGTLVQKQIHQVTRAKIPSNFHPTDPLYWLLNLLLDNNPSNRAKNIAAIKNEPYFKNKAIDWQKMRKQQWSPSFLPNLE